jgi:hypothetical protein
MFYHVKKDVIMPNRIYTLGQKIIQVPKFIANCIFSFGSYIVSKCEKLINYITHKNNDFPDDPVINRDITNANPEHGIVTDTEGFVCNPENIQNQLTKKGKELETKHFNEVTSLILDRRYVRNDNTNYLLNAVYRYITQLWANIAGQEEFNIRLDLADILKVIKSDTIDYNNISFASANSQTTDDNYISFINMMLNLYYIKQDSQDIKECANLILEIQKFLYNVGDIKNLMEVIAGSQLAMHGANLYGSKEKEKNYLVLFFSLVATVLPSKIESDIIFNTPEDLQHTVNKISMFQEISCYANKLYLNSINNKESLSPTDCYLIVYSYLATEQDIKVNLKLPKISARWKQTLQQAKKELTKNIDLTKIIEKENLLQLERRQEIDKYLYNELPIDPEKYESKDVECILTSLTPADTEQNNFVKYERQFYTYDAFRTLYIQQGKEPCSRSEIDLSNLQRVIYTAST